MMEAPPGNRRRFFHARTVRLADPSPPAIMGILNATPDSFSDGGTVPQGAMAARVEALIDEGADILDIGGESTRPGAETVPVEEEWARIAPALEAATGHRAVVSVDTRKAAVARRALATGARMFNDVSALTYDPDSMAVAQEYAAAGGAVCLMHALGDPKTMQTDPHYDDVVREVRDYLAARVRACEAAGIARTALIVDPGIGFGKTLAHNLTLLRNLGALREIGCRVLLGASRKGFIGALSGEKDAARRMPGSLAVALHGARQGADILRVHDVAETVQALAVDTALRGA